MLGRTATSARRFLAVTMAMLLTLGAAAPALAYTQEQQQELQIGRQEYQSLQQKGEIITSSPYYKILDPIAQRIAAIADPQYFVPFHFILVNQAAPNAFAVPGGNVYVTIAMMHFVKNKEELAGVLCHETSHDIHNDVMNLYAKNQQLGLYAGIASLIFGKAEGGLAYGAINIAANLESLHFSRAVEQNADHKGAITCAQAGLDSWGMVWLMRAFKNSAMPNPSEFLSNHPTDQERINALKAEFAQDPTLFGNLNPNVACGTPLSYNGFYDQYKGGCGPVLHQSRTGRNGASATQQLVCPPHWKFCPPHRLRFR